MLSFPFIKKFKKTIKSTILISTTVLILTISTLGMINQTVIAQEAYALARKNTINFDWNQTVGLIPSNICGMNVRGGLVPYWGQTGNYVKSLQYLSPNAIRVHDSIWTDGIQNWRGWADNKTKGWNREKIKLFANNVRKWRANAINPDITITLGGFPDWMKKQKIYNWKWQEVTEILDYSQVDDLAEFYLDLVKILNTEENLNINSFEITNEMDIQYAQKLTDNNMPTRMNDLADIYIEVARKLKNHDSRFNLGGLSFARADQFKNVEIFLERLKVRNSKDLLDFLSYHFYITGDKNEYTGDIIQKADTAIPFFQKNYKQLLWDKGFPNVKTNINEFNISWDGADQKMTNQDSAMVDAVVLLDAVNNRVDYLSPWTDVDNEYGKFDQYYNQRPAATIWNWCSKYMNGGFVLNQNNISGVDLMPVKMANGKKAVWAVNKSNYPQTVNISSNLGRSYNFQWLQISNVSQYSREYTLDNNIGSNLVLPGNSVSIATW